MPPVRSQDLERFAGMGLNGNPFRVADESELAKLYVAPIATGDKSAHEIARSSDPVTQIIAPRGWGKSTLLFALREEFETLGVRCHYAYCSPKKPVRWQVPDVAPRLRLDQPDPGLILIGRKARAPGPPQSGTAGRY